MTIQSNDPSSLERKWYIYVEDRHEGPYSFDQIDLMIEDESLTSSDYLWHRDLPDWQPVSEARLLLSNNSPKAASEVIMPAAPRRLLTVDQKIKPKPKHSQLKPILLFSLSIALLPSLGYLIFRGFLSQLAPKTETHLQPTPTFTALDLANNNEVRAAALASLETVGPAAAIAVVEEATGLAPSFSVSTNLPSGSHLRLRLQGIPGSLVGPAQNPKDLELITQRSLTQPGSHAQIAEPKITQGEYLASVIDPEGKTLTKKKLFLGGPNDLEYDRRLKEYHDELIQKSQYEITEMKQFCDTLENQLRETNLRFEKLDSNTQLSPESKLMLWKEFHKKWNALQSKLREHYTDLQTTTQSGALLQGPLLMQTRQAGERVDQIHQEQSQYFTPEGDMKALGLKVAEEASIAQSSLLSLKMKLNFLKKAPPSANGLPRTDAP